MIFPITDVNNNVKKSKIIATLKCWLSQTKIFLTTNIFSYLDSISQLAHKVVDKEWY